MPPPCVVHRARRWIWWGSSLTARRLTEAMPMWVSRASSACWTPTTLATSVALIGCPSEEIQTATSSRNPASSDSGDSQASADSFATNPTAWNRLKPRAWEAPTSDEEDPSDGETGSTHIHLLEATPRTAASGPWTLKHHAATTVSGKGSLGERTERTLSWMARPPPHRQVFSTGKFAWPANAAAQY